LIVLVVIIALVGVFVFIFNQLIDTPTVNVFPNPTYNFSKTPTSYFTELSQYEINVTQGQIFQINLTITSFLNQTTIFTSNIDLAGYGNAAWDTSQDSHMIFNATFSQKNLTLGPQAKESTLLTIYMAQNAPTGKYLFYINNTAMTVNVTPSSTKLSTAPKNPNN